MKKISFVIFLLGIVFSLQAQNITLTSKNAKFRLGFNIGNLYQCSDVERLPGFGYGLTLERILKPGSDDFFSFSLRARYLHGISKGLDYQSFSGIQNNVALNGTRNTLINYASSPGYVYNNYRTKITDFSGELMLYFNQLWLKTHILLYGWGGFSLASYEATINAVDGFGNMYDYSSVMPGTKDFVRDQLKSMLDKKYESYGDNLAGPELLFGPSAGIGLGVQLTRRIAVGIEHKVTWTNTDLLDGQQWDKNNIRSTDDDIYHYTVLGLKFLLGGSDETKKKDKTKPQTEDPRRPQIFITEPQQNPYLSPDCKTYITGSVTNLTSAQQLVIKENNVVLPPTAYFFRPETGTFKIEKTITQNSEYQIIATNQYGSAIKFQHIHCTPKINKPIITIEKPQANPFQTNNCFAEIIAHIENIKGKENITVTENNAPLLAAEYTFNTYNRLIINKNIKDRSVFVITARNEAGTTSAEVVIDCRKPSNKPEVKITLPSVSPFITSDCKADIRALATGITNKSQISITENGNLLSSSFFTFDPVSGLIKINKNISGSSTFVIKVQNENGSASASTIIQCKQLPKTPFVEITNPSVNPFTTEDCRANITATIQNIENINQISVFEGSNQLSSTYYTYDSYAKILKINKLLSGSAVIKIVVRNEAGSAEDAVEIKCLKALPPLPKVTITEPKANPFVTSNCNIIVYALVENIKGSEQLTVTENGFSLNTSFWKYNHANGIVSISKEISGTSVFEITARNEAGNSKASATINCDKKSLQPCITIVSPQQNPYQTTDCKVSVRANTTNVTNKSQIMIKENGVVIPSTSYSFDNSGVITMTKDFSGKSNIEIKVTTANGTASASLVVECLPKALPPVVTLVEPNVSPYLSADCIAKVKFSVKNIENKNQLVLKENGSIVPSSSWFYDAAENMVSYTKNITGESNFELTATTTAGTSSAKATIRCQRQEQKLPKIVITFPVQNPFKTSECNVQVKALATNVTLKNQITIKDNGTILTSEAFSFDPASGIISFTRNVSTKSIVEIKVNTPSGSAVASLVIECTPKPELPVITITQPTTNPYTSPDCNTGLKATIRHINTKSQISVKESGSLLPENLWSFDPSSGLLSLNKSVVGEQLYEITATNQAGTSTAKITIKCQPKILPPTVVISSPAISPYVTTDCKATVIAKTTNISQKSQINIKENGVTIQSDLFTFDPVKQQVTLTKNFAGTAVYEIFVTNESGTSSAKTTFQCQIPKKPPTVKIVQPTQNPFMTSECNAIIQATVTNIENKSQITVKEGNTLLTQNDFEFDIATKTIRVKRNVKGTVNFEITVSNQDGSATARQTITCIEPVLPPVVTITQPALNPYNTYDCKADIRANVKNVTDKNNISIFAGNQKLTASEFNFDAATGNISFIKALPQSSTIKITATNSAGTSGAEVTINCLQKADPPEVVIITPSSDPYLSAQCNAYVIAKTKKITSKNQITIYKNGSVLDGMYYNFNEEEGEIMFDQGLSGETTFRIVVKNEGGSAEDKVTIKCPPPVKTPDIKILSPASNPAQISTCRAVLQAKILDFGDDGKLDVRENGKILPASNYQFDKATGLLNITREFVEKTTFTINVSNKAGSKSESISFVCSGGEKLPLVTITTPVENPYYSADCSLYLTADVINVQDADGLTVQVNGKELENSQYTFNADSGKLVVNTRNLPAKAKITLTARNEYGTTVRSLEVNCKPGY
ncbi:MAG: hypothetical protein GX437_01595 [Sphingobacteriales bacterium]|nr:hypothetical protein [Sphingobacteriales bacterium]